MKLYRNLALVGALAFLSACSPEPKFREVTTTIYRGESQNRDVEIVQEVGNSKVVKYDKIGAEIVTELSPDYHLSVYTTPKRLSEEKSIDGLSNLSVSGFSQNHEGYFEQVQIRGEVVNLTSPGPTFEARKILDQAMVDVGNFEHQVSSTKRSRRE